MILSMTGYGTGSAQNDDVSVSIELKSVNHRFLDLHLRMSREYQFLEHDIQQLVRGSINRGRVDINVTIQHTASCGFRIDTDLVRRYLDAADSLSREFTIPGSLDMKAILNLPGVLHNGNIPVTDDGTLPGLVKSSMREALEGLMKMRRREGDALREDMLGHLDAIEASTGQIRNLSEHSAEEQLRTLRERITRLLPQGGVDPQRLAQEAALIADKYDISEEVSRIGSHIEQYRSFIDAEEKSGKKLDFLLQEMQREANTILSKSGNLEITHHGISIKTDIEKLREQVQNVE
jgi:uncharacterized protein (TIGR00255 family)